MAWAPARAASRRGSGPAVLGQHPAAVEHEPGDEHERHGEDDHERGDEAPVVPGRWPAVITGSGPRRRARALLAHRDHAAADVEEQQVAGRHVAAHVGDDHRSPPEPARALDRHVDLDAADALQSLARERGLGGELGLSRGLVPRRLQRGDPRGVVGGRDHVALGIGHAPGQDHEEQEHDDQGHDEDHLGRDRAVIAGPWPRREPAVPVTGRPGVARRGGTARPG